MTAPITIHLTPGELLEAYHAHQTRWNTTEQRDASQSAAAKLAEAYATYTQNQP